jgi:hypothetical protein
VDGNTTGTVLAGWPPTRFAPWRLRSQVCVPVDWLVGAAGAILIVVPGLDSLLSWPTNNVVVQPGKTMPPRSSGSDFCNKVHYSYDVFHLFGLCGTTLGRGPGRIFVRRQHEAINMLVR